VIEVTPASEGRFEGVVAPQAVREARPFSGWLELLEIIESTLASPASSSLAAANKGTRDQRRPDRQ
jgi:hypothetical protein